MAKKKAKTKRTYGFDDAGAGGKRRVSPKKKARFSMERTYGKASPRKATSRAKKR